MLYHEGEPIVIGPSAHSKIGASSMHRWGECPGSVALCDKLPPQPPGPWAEEGTLAHEWAAICLMTSPRLGILDAESYAAKGKMEHLISDEMKQAVEVYVKWIETLWEEIQENSGIEKKRGHFIVVERKFDLSKLFPGLFGTADCVVYDSKKKVLHVIDYKHGQGVFVGAEENEQLMYYALGALESFNVPVKFINVVVVQPRFTADNVVRQWTTTGLRLLEFGDELVKKAKAALAPDAPLKSGPHCKFCAAKPVCPALEQKANEAALIAFKPVPTALMDAEKVGKALALADDLETWIKAVREYAYSEAKAGRPPAGWKLVEKRATRKWKDPRTAAQAIETLFNVSHEQMFETKLKSPPQIEKVLGKQFGLLADHVVAESSGDTLVPLDDKRPEVKRDAQSVFLPVKPTEGE